VFNAPGRAIMFDRITFSSNQMAGRACIRGMRITVALLLNLVANGLSTEEIIREYPDIEPEDIRQALSYAAALANEEPTQSCPSLVKDDLGFWIYEGEVPSDFDVVRAISDEREARMRKVAGFVTFN